MIPKTIHFCWFGEKPYTPLINDCMKSWQNHLSSYTIKKWNENNFALENKFVKEAYKNKKYAFVSDYARLWALYEFGGVYLDTDMFVIKNLDSLLTNECFFGYEEPDSQFISAGVIGAQKGNLFIKKLLDDYQELTFSSDLHAIAIPKIITKNYKEYEDRNGITIYNCDYFYPLPQKKKNTKNFLTYAKNNTYAIHLWGGAWVGFRDKILYRLNKFLKHPQS